MKKFLRKSKCGKRQVYKQREIWSENRGNSGINFRCWLTARKRTRVRTGVLRPLVFPRRLHGQIWPKGEKKPRELERARRSTKRRSRGAAEKKHSFTAKRTLHGETKARSSRSLPRPYPSFPLRPALIPVAPLSPFNFVLLAPIFRFFCPFSQPSLSFSLVPLSLILFDSLSKSFVLIFQSVAFYPSTFFRSFFFSL